METIPLDDPKKISGHRSLNAMVLWDKVDSWSKKRNLPSLLSFSALLVCILPHCRLRDWCGNLRKASGHVVCRLDQSASFRILDSTFYFPHSAIPHFTHISLRSMNESGRSLIYSLANWQYFFARTVIKNRSHT